MLKTSEMRRQLLHISAGILILFLTKYGILNPARIFIILIFGIILSIVAKKVKIPVIYWFLLKFERKEELKRFPGRGVIYFFAGTLLVLMLFPADIAYASIMILALGDSISHIAGIRIGKFKHPFSKVKLIEGTLVGTLFAFIGAMFFVSPLEALLASVGAMTAEVVEFRMNEQTVDDNLIVPLVAGTIIFLVRTYLIPLF
ncbi:MAG: SEC59/DGK1/VTE5 family protein [bacterium]|nr:SEC59/DGK1/VTE5 family protein [bacterium]